MMISWLTKLKVVGIFSPQIIGAQYHSQSVNFPCCELSGNFLGMKLIDVTEAFLMIVYFSDNLRCFFYLR